MLHARRPSPATAAPPRGAGPAETHRRTVGPLALAVLAGLLPAAPARAGDDACFTCHAREKYSAQGVTRHQVVPCNGCHAAYAAVCTKGRAVTAPPRGTLTASVAAKAPRAPQAAAECRGCHPVELAAYAASAHGQALLARGRADAPYCMDCHGPAHALGRRLKDDRQAAQLAAIEACARCHSDRELAGANALSPYVTDTYRDSIHLKFVALGDYHSPACHDCHGTHAVHGKEDPRSLVSKENVVATCAQCHEGATMHFATSFAHQPFTRDALAVGFYVTQFFTYVTFFTLGLLVFHMALDAAKLLRARRSKERGARGGPP